jgi:glutamyl/glutaminyl-tRNA synthetase
LFTLEGISGGNAVFNPEKLDWFNQQHIARLPAPELLRRIKNRLRARTLWRDNLLGDEAAWIEGVLELLKPRVKKLDQLVDELEPFLVDLPEFDPGAIDKHLSSSAVRDALGTLADRYDRLQPFDATTTETVLRSVAQEAGLKAAPLIHATRVAVTGRAVSAGLFDVLARLGSKRVVKRLRHARDYTPVS